MVRAYLHVGLNVGRCMKKVECQWNQPFQKSFNDPPFYVLGYYIYCNTNVVERPAILKIRSTSIENYQKMEKWDGESDKISCFASKRYAPNKKTLQKVVLVQKVLNIVLRVSGTLAHLNIYLPKKCPLFPVPPPQKGYPLKKL